MARREMATTVAHAALTADAAPASSDAEEDVADVATRLRRIVVEEYDFIWRSLRRFGVSEAAAEDAAQQVFLIASKKLADVPIELERSFLFGTIVRVAANVRRLTARRREVPETEGDEGPPELANAETLLDRKQALAVLDEIVGAMPEDRRAIFVLFELEELKLVEIAALLDLPMGTVASRLRRARDDFHAAIARVRARNQAKGESR